MSCLATVPTAAERADATVPQSVQVQLYPQVPITLWFKPCPAAEMGMALRRGMVEAERQGLFFAQPKAVLS